MLISEVQKRIWDEAVAGMGSDCREILFAGVFEEAGEIAGLHKRELRNFTRDQSRLKPEYMREEIGDLLWYVFALCSSFGYNIEDIFEQNRLKLEERYGRHQSSESL